MREKLMTEQIHALLQGRQGTASAISARSICEVLGWDPSFERAVRALIEIKANDAWEGTLVAIPGRGYFFAETIEEVGAYRQYLVSLKEAAEEKLWRFDAAVARSGLSLKEVLT
jgi:hypothetical protein